MLRTLLKKVHEVPRSGGLATVRAEHRGSVGWLQGERVRRAERYDACPCP